MLRPVIAACCALFVVSAALAAARANPEFPQTEFELGKIVQGAVIEQSVTFSNGGSADLVLGNLRMTAPLNIAAMPRKLAPGQSGVIRFKLDTAELLGDYQGAALVEFADAAVKPVMLRFAGSIVATVEVSPQAAFFIGAQRGEAKEQSLEIINHEAEPVRIEAVKHGDERFSTRLDVIEEGARYRLTLRLRSDLPAGRHADRIEIRTSSAKTPVLEVAANIQVHERVYTFPDQVHFGEIPLAMIEANPALLEQLTQTLMVYRKGTSDFEAEASTAASHLTLSAERGPAGDRYEITVRLTPEAIKAGPIAGTIVIDTNDPEFPRLEVPVSGAFLGE